MEHFSDTNYNNTVAKGDALENETADLLRKLLSSGDFFLPGKHSKLFQKKKYYSQTRNREIVFDISIETTLPGANTYSILTLIECKNYGRPIEVEKMEAFDSKVRGVGEHNTRAMFVTNNVLQPAAYQTALSKKIAVIRLFTADQYQWINYRKKRDFNFDLESASHMFTDDTYKSSNFVGVINNKVFDNIPDLLIEGQIMDYYTHKEKFVRIPFLTDERFDAIVKRLDAYDLRHGVALDEEKLCHFLSDKYTLTFDLEAVLPRGILGKIIFDPLKIMISEELKNDRHKFRFTLAHEVAHLILHKKILEGIDEKVDGEDTIFSGNYSDNEQSRRIEYQANRLASLLLLPTDKLIRIVASYFRLENINKGYLYLDRQPVNQQLANKLLLLISESFGVSYSAAKIRLVGLELIRDQAGLGIRDILKRR